MSTVHPAYFGPFVAPTLYDHDDGRIVRARCLCCDERWEEGGDETLFAFAGRHDRSYHPEPDDQPA